MNISSYGMIGRPAGPTVAPSGRLAPASRSPAPRGVAGVALVRVVVAALSARRVAGPVGPSAAASWTDLKLMSAVVSP